MSILRAFIAIELSDEIVEALAAIQQRLKREPAAQHVRWVAPGSIHLTLKFIGDLDSARVPRVVDILRSSAAGEQPHELAMQGLGGFPNLQRPNVIWAGVTGPVEVASRIARRLEDGCAALGIAREDRPFSPHLTLGRVQRDAGPDVRRQIGDLVRRQPAGEIGRFAVSAVYLMRSELKPSGAVYSVLGQAPLG